MCYHCATNPSIHHHCRRVAAVSSPLSHHGVTFTVTSSQFRRCHCDVAFIVALLLRCCLHCCIVMVSSSWFCHRHCGVAFVIALSRCHCRSHVVAVPLLS